MWLKWVGISLAALLLGAGGIGWYRISRPDYRLGQGQKALLEGDVDKADALADRLQDSGYPDHAHLLRGQVYLHRQRLNEAILEYNQIRQDQENILVQASLAYGLAFLSVGRYERAEKLLLYVAGASGDNVDAHRGL